MGIKCLDTYALIELHNQNERFHRYEEEDVVTTDLNIAEFFGVLYRKYNLQTAEYWGKKLAFLARPVQREILLKAMQYKIENNKQDLSFFDCVGYMFAREHGMVFVTGDKAFEHKVGVEFVQ